MSQQGGPGSSTGTECLGNESVAAFVAGALGPDELERVDLHLGNCTQCLWLVTAATAGAAEDASSQSVCSTKPERFERHALIAEGGMGRVYLGYDRQDRVPVAIKRLRQGLIEQMPRLLGLFKREAELLRRLNHPNIVRLVAWVTTDGCHELVMEYVSGGSLRELLNAGQLPMSHVLRIAVELADALSRAHHLRIIHRDLKPENVLMAPDGTPRLGDFGLARALDQSGSTASGVVGTVSYMSPEALLGEPLDERTDLWGMGVVLFEMLTGARPFTGSSTAEIVRAITRCPVPDLEAVCPKAPVALVDLVYRLLEKDRGQRLGSARRLAAELEAITRPPIPSLAPRPASPGESENRHGLSSSAEGKETGSTRMPKALPCHQTPFLGRKRELADLAALLARSEVRAVTVLGPGGIGKSTLALEFGRQLASGTGLGALPALSGFAGRVVFVDLAPLTSSEHTLRAVADAIGYQFSADVEAQVQLANYLRGRELLLVMDNFEHIAEGAGIVTRLLVAAPRLKFLITSRERLGLGLEIAFDLSGMPVPEGSAGHQVGSSDAVALFVASARRVLFGFAPNAQDAAQIARICRLVQGMPLGIILAAAWVPVLAVAEIADQIARDVDFLAADFSALPERQQSMRAVFEHSWARLSPEEQRVLAAIGAFRGGFTRAAVASVAGASLRVLATLVEKSFVRRNAESGRYEIHELLRQFAEQRLRHSPADYESVMGKLAGTYSAFVSARTAALRGVGRTHAAREIQAEYDNVRQAVDWMLLHRRSDMLCGCLDALATFYHYRAPCRDAECAFEEIAKAFTPLEADATSEQRRLVGVALTFQSIFCEGRSRRDSVDVARRAVEVMSEAEHGSDYGRALLILAWMSTGTREPGPLIAMADHGIALFRAEGDELALSRALIMTFAPYFWAGDLDGAEVRLRESLTLQRKFGGGAVAFPNSVTALAMIRCAQGRWREGSELLIEALALAEKYEDVWEVAEALKMGSRSLRMLGEYADAEALARRAVNHALDVGRLEIAAWSRIGLAGMLADQQRFDEAMNEYTEAAQGAPSDPEIGAAAELGLGEVARLRGEPIRAREHLERSARMFEREQTAWGLASTLVAAAELACDEGHCYDAEALLCRALAIEKGRRRPTAVVSVIFGFARVCASTDRKQRAARLASLVHHHPATPHATRARQTGPLLAELERSLPEAQYAEACAAGRAQPLDAAIEELAQA